MFTKCEQTNILNSDLFLLMLITTKKIINIITKLWEYHIMVNLNYVSRRKPVFPERLIKIPI